MQIFLCCHYMPLYATRKCKLKASPEPEILGEYRGFSMELAFREREHVILLKGALTHRAVLGNDSYGNITRIDNVPDGKCE